ncbi:hypothetical protein H4R23_001155 [Coemansia sp. Cherry 401B]|nr:hypothetical protein H4R23_001155 [Coemansia sp. Cherry 401B]
MSSTPGTSAGTKRARGERHGWRGDVQPLRKYTPTPTSGTARLHQLHDYGFADFSPATSAMAECVLNERTIRYGFVDAPIVANEHVSSHDVVHDRLRDTRVFQELQTFAAGVVQRQWARGAIGGGDVPRLPNRTVRSDERRDEWLRALANARVPLSTLAGSVPFGLRGERLLEALRQHDVPLTRALWAIRLTGACEMFASLTREPDHPSLKQLEIQYTATWSRQFTQFVEHTLAAAPTSSADGTAAWTRNWDAALALLHAQYDHGLLDQRHLVSWLVSQFRQAPVDKCMVLLPLLQEYTREIARSRNPLRKLIAAVVSRIEQAARYQALRAFQGRLRAYLAELFAAQPDAFVEPSTWHTYRTALQTAGATMPENERRVLLAEIRQVDARNRRFACLANDGDGAAEEKPAGSQAQLFRTLGELGPDSDIGHAAARVFGDGASIDGHRVRLVCYWAAEDLDTAAETQLRQLIAARLCRLHLDRTVPSQSLAASQLQTAIVGFLDTFLLPADSSRDRAVRRVCALLERLADVQCFSISKYLQLLTARGDFFGANLKQLRSQRHLAYVTSVPANGSDDYAQRQMLMYDCSDSRVLAVDADSPVCVQLKRGLSALLPFLVAYTCAAPLRARASSSSSSTDIDLDTVRWWLPHPADLFDARMLLTPAQLATRRLQSPQAQSACTKDWIAPAVDHFDDERVLGSDTAAALRRLLAQAQRSEVDLVLNHRLLPIVYDYVVKDVTVGADNWRVITQPGTSLLNRRQAAVVVSVLAEAGYFGQLLDLLLWLLAHTRVNNIVALAHATLRRYTHMWSLLGRLPGAVAQVEQLYAANSGSESFDFESLRTAHHWGCVDPELAGGFYQRVAADYEAFAGSHAPALLLPGGHVPSQTTAGKELLQLAQQLVRDRAREAISSVTDEIDWAILPCFQKLARLAYTATQRSDLGSSPGHMHVDLPGSPTGPHRPRLQAMLAYIATEAARAALHTGRTLRLGMADRAADEVQLRTFVELCVLLIRWFALNSGLLLEPESVGPVALAALAAAAGEWTLATNGVSATSLEAVAETQDAAGEPEIAMFIGHVFVSSLLAAGCLRIHELVPWLVKCCSAPATPQGAAQFACVAGMLRALGEPSPDNGAVSDSVGISDPRHLYEVLEMGAHWTAAFATQRLSRIQAIELVFTSASASGRLRDMGASQIAASLMHAASALAQSRWIQRIVDYIPNADDSGYYTVLEIYRANIEPQIVDSSVSLPVKRALLRALMTLCEGSDPTADGFSAMTTAEVAHRLHRTLRNFWAARRANVHKLSTILNSLLLFAGSALRESEASTDAFAVAAGGARMIVDSVATSSGHSRTASQEVDSNLEQVQFVTNATAYVVACVQTAVLTWNAGELGIDRQCARLAEALGTLAPDVVMQLVEAGARTLFVLNMDQLRSVEVAADDAPDEDTKSRMPVDRRVAAIVGASAADVGELVSSFIEIHSAPPAAAADDGDTGTESVSGSRRGFALARFIQQLVATLGKLSEDDRKRGFAAGSTLAMVRDFACGILGQLQAIAVHASADVAKMLALCVTHQERAEQPADLDPQRLQMAVSWRLQTVHPLCHLLRLFPDEFGAGEWLTTLVTLCLAPACQSTHQPHLFQFLADFAAIVSESLTAPMRKQALFLLRSVAPRLRSMVRSPYADSLSRLFPFEMSTVLTRDLAPRDCEGLDNPWMWIEALEFVPLAAQNSAALNASGLEGMTPFTLRGMLELENGTGYLASLRMREPNASREQQVDEYRKLQYLENPYFPMQPAMLFPLAQTPIPWQLFGAKRRRVDAETRLVWRAQCQAEFGAFEP